ncbi:hypothetical protein MNBD_CHLOROFLEXI01-214 [hydrothermal vent metagenome]|uniref:Uncharacterized protein n=1 Tax=hydrothermal vent metagenome TaxID=652676 RepID=A0A3B0UY47_9ZZZZ
MSCPPETKVRLLFSSDPASLTEATFFDALIRADQENVLSGGQAIRLPTPTLVGLPQDEVGYQTLFRGYAAQMLALAINDATGWECCQRVPIYQATVARQLYELGVGEWPLASSSPPTAVSLPNELLLFANEFVHWNAPFLGTSSEFAQTPAPYAVVDFLTNDLHLPTAQIAASLALTKDEPFSQWLLKLAGPEWTEATLGHAFREYVKPWQSEPSELPQPEADLLLLCRTDIGNDLAIYQYDFLEDEPLLLENLDYSEAFFTGLPNGSGLAVVGWGEDGKVETFLLRNGERRIAVNWNEVEGVTSRPPLAIPTVTDANGRYLLWTVTSGLATGIFYGLTDLDACDEGSDCEIIPLGGYPIWSPNSEQLLTLTVTNPWWREGLNNGLMLLRQELTADATGSPGFGYSPFWLNDEQFGYIVHLQNGNQQLMLTDSELSTPRMIVDNDTLRASFPAHLQPTSLAIQFANSLSTNLDTLLILAAETRTDGNAFLVVYNQVKDEMSVLSLTHPVPNIDEMGVRISPDGRFLLMTIADETDEVAPSSRLLLQETNGSQFFAYPLLGETPYPRHFYASWSPDGQWLAMPELGYVRLWHNGRDEQLLTFDNLSCTNVAWVNKIEH